MINYIRSELYRNLRNKSNYFLILGIMAFVIFINVALWGFAKNDMNFPYATTKFSFSSLYTGLEIVIIMTLVAVSVTFAQEYKNQTFKNTVSFGISKNSIYFGKFIVSIIYSLVTAVSVIIVFVASAYMLLENSGIEHLNLLISSIIAASPLFLLSLAVAHCFYFIMDKEMGVIGWWVIIFIVIPRLLDVAGRKNEIIASISKLMPLHIIDNITFNEVTNTFILGWTTPEAIIKSIFVGVIGSIVFYLIGLEIFKRKEIK